MQIITARSEAVRQARGSQEDSLLAALDLDLSLFPDIERLIDWFDGTGQSEGTQG